MKIINRHRRSIFLLGIAGLLLAGAFYISQQIRSGDDRPGFRPSSPIEKVTLDDIPMCAERVSIEEKRTCYIEAVEISESLVDSVVDEVLALEPETARRIAFLETQNVWEESRAADCAFVRGAASEEVNKDLQELVCMLDHNLSRLEQLEQYRCVWFYSGDCDSSSSDQE